MIICIYKIQKGEFIMDDFFKRRDEIVNDVLCENLKMANVISVY